MTELATSDEGAFVYAATDEGVIAINEAQPGLRARRVRGRGRGASLAPIPKESSLSKGSGGSTGPLSSNGTGNTSGSGNGKPTHAPATDTEGGGPLFRVGPDPVLLLAVGGVIVVGVLLGSHVLLKRIVAQ